MPSFPENPFRPGAGLDPAHRGERPEVEDVLTRLLQTLRRGQAGAEFGFLYGPRGNGKTVLLQWLEAEAKRRSSGRRIVQVRIARAETGSPETVAQAILDAISNPRSKIGLTAEAKIGVPGMASVRVTGTGRSRPTSLAHVLSEKTTPLLLALDEAHEAPPEMLGDLLDLAQIAGRHRSVAVIFAGTPGLEATMRAAHASFWSRGEKLRIGLLTEMSAREVLARPFREADLEADDGAVAELTAAADNYPYFLQLYGRAAWRVVEASGGRTLRPEHVKPALAAAHGARQDYCLDRLNEFGDVDMLPLARRVAEAFVESAAAPADRRLSLAALDEMLADHGDAIRSRAFLIAKGYVWQDTPGDPSWTPGIPSLMDYMLARIPAS